MMAMINIKYFGCFLNFFSFTSSMTYSFIQFCDKYVVNLCGFGNIRDISHSFPPDKNLLK